MLCLKSSLQGSLDRIVRVWDAQTGYFLDRFEGHKDSVYSVAFSPDGKSLVSGSLDKTLKIWDLGRSGLGPKCRMTLNGHKVRNLAQVFSSNFAKTACFAGLCPLRSLFSRWQMDCLRVQRPNCTILGSQLWADSVHVAGT